MFLLFFYQVVLVKSRLRAFNRCLAAGWQETRGFEWTPDVLDRHPGSLLVWCIINSRYPSDPVIFVRVLMLSRIQLPL